LNADGTIAAMSSTVDSNPSFTGKFVSSTGAYQVRFNATVLNCVPVASVHTDGAFGSVVGFTTVGFTSSSQVSVHIANANGTPLDASFNLIVACE